MSSSLLAGAALVLTTSLAATGLSPAAVQPDVACGWRITAVHVLAELTGDDSERAETLREALLSVGANRAGFVPDSCYQTGSSGSGSGSGSGSIGSGSGSGSGSTGSDPEPDEGGDGTPSGSGGSSGAVSGGDDSLATAGDTFGWGEPDVVDNFDDGLSGWNMYDGPGHAGNGVRSPDAASVSDGVLTINGTGDGTTAGMAWSQYSQQYGRWEVQMRAPVGDPAYNALALLWPTAENFPVGGEVDFAEIMDSDRNKVELFLHYGEDNSQVHGEVEVDATAWQNYAVEWTPEGITAFLNGEEWWKTTDTSILPPGPMHLCLQLDWFPGNGGGDSGEVSYAWVKQWSYDGDGSSTDSEASEGSGDEDSSTTITDEINGASARIFGGLMQRLW
ncbi:glycoside hydrolase family 16 protein [Pseudonocardia nematodicida]|uniref:Glycoside hydrolase family 16 protein n=1 Tax=Pseudonocardia nematodicida TaxID=1206997 RepID=A0ABV1KEH1_9PSEU